MERTEAKAAKKKPCMAATSRYHIPVVSQPYTCIMRCSTTPYGLVPVHSGIPPGQITDFSVIALHFIAPVVKSPFISIEKEKISSDRIVRLSTSPCPCRPRWSQAVPSPADRALRVYE